jgi:hypothetical protein
MYALDTLTIHGILKLEHVGLVVHASDALHIFHTKESNNKNNTINKRNNKFIKELSLICSYEDNYFLIGHTGISYCHIGTDTIGDAKFEFLDMSFNSAAIAEGEDGKLILGSTTGLYIYEHDHDDGNHKMEHVVIPQDTSQDFFIQNVWIFITVIALIIFAGFYFRIFKPQKAKNEGTLQSGNKGTPQSGNKQLASSSQQRIEGSIARENPTNGLPQPDDTAQVTSDESAPPQKEAEGNTNPANNFPQSDDTPQVPSKESVPPPQEPEENTVPKKSENDLSQTKDTPQVTSEEPAHTQQGADENTNPENTANDLSQPDNTPQVPNEEPAHTQQEPEENTVPQNPENNLPQSDDTPQVTSEEPATSQQEPEGNTVPKNPENDLQQQMDKYLKRIVTQVYSIIKIKHEGTIKEKSNALRKDFNEFIGKFKKDIKLSFMKPGNQIAFHAILFYIESLEQKDIKTVMKAIFGEISSPAHHRSSIRKAIKKIPEEKRTAFMNKLYENIKRQDKYENIKLLQGENKSDNQ